MKKKIKDLNDYEIDIICKNNKCDNCPLNPDVMVPWCKNGELDKYGDEEVEVEENENR